MKYDYSQLNNKSYEELKQIRESVMNEIQKNEDERQSLIRNILFLQEFSDLYSIQNGILGKSNSENENDLFQEIDKALAENRDEVRAKLGLTPKE